MSAAERVTAFLDRWATGRGNDPEMIYGLDGKLELTVSDLRELVRHSNEYQGLMASEAGLRRLAR